MSVAETSYQMLEVLAFCARQRLRLYSIKVTVLITWMKEKVQLSFYRNLFFENTRKKI